MHLQSVVLAVLLGSSSLATAANILVTSTADNLTAGDGACTLREAIINANTDTDTTAGDCAAGSGVDVVSLPAGRYERTGGPRDELATWTSLTIRGAGAGSTIIDATNDSPLGQDSFGLAVRTGIGGGGGATRVLIERVTITGATEGVYNADVVLTVSDAVITRNGSCFPGWGCWGKGVFDDSLDSQAGTTLIRTTVTSNRGPGVVAGAFTRIENSTISGNTSVNQLVCIPGYPDCWCEVHPAAILGPARVLYSTIADNHVDSSNCSGSPMFAVDAGTFTGSVISNPGIANCAGSHASLGHNLDSDGTCGFSDPTDLSNVDPLLGPLQDNGGPTPTHALLPGSPALNAIPVADCTWDDDGNPGTPEVPLRKDQRGAARPQGAGCDIGAFEATSCSDGRDNDGDGFVDYPADPGCRFATSTLERTQCQDGLNNDGKTGIDFDGGASVNGGVPLDVRDPQCTYGWQNKERSGCGLGFEVVLIAPLLARLTRQRRA